MSRRPAASWRTRKAPDAIRRSTVLVETFRTRAASSSLNHEEGSLMLRLSARQWRTLEIGPSGAVLGR